ncbi:hypothetical protein [Phenylobacterium sp. J367]|uniref:hypothetical protein n=1 Tax=Phenylobacterium sp. J367 TaxID=2898435 RepID=UPI002150A36E|nr:hypothetical protein [Phenylobacterium sp. J367]MCR5880943.1 hypothetical protein [Phenylobacterium sp. J367]
MAPPRKRAGKAARPSLRERTPIVEWCAAALGLILTLGVVGYSAWEGLGGGGGPPDLRAEVREVHALGSGHVVEFQVRNLSAATAADVVVSATLRSGAAAETHSVTLDYVPGLGAARGGLVFKADPAGGTLTIAAEAYGEP